MFKSVNFDRVHAGETFSNALTKTQIAINKERSMMILREHFCKWSQ